MVGASGFEWEPELYDWNIAVTRRRSIMQHLRGRNRMKKSDPMFTLVYGILREQEDFEDPSCDDFRVQSLGESLREIGRGLKKCILRRGT